MSDEKPLLPTNPERLGNCNYCQNVGGADPLTACPICGKVSDERGDPDEPPNLEPHQADANARLVASAVYELSHTVQRENAQLRAALHGIADESDRARWLEAVAITFQLVAIVLALSGIAAAIRMARS